MRFRDFDEFSASNGVFEIDLLQLAAAPVDQRVLRVVLDRMVLMRGWESTAYLTRAANPPGTSTLMFQLASTGVSWWRGREATQRSLLSYQDRAEHVGRSTGGMVWAAIFFQADALRDTSLALRGVVPTVQPFGAAFLEPDPTSLGALRGAAQQAFLVAESAPQLLEAPAVRRSLEETILTAGVTAIDPQNGRRTPDGPLISYERVVARVEDALVDKIDSPIYLADLCKAAGVSERTVRNSFQSLYHVSPIRFLRLRRLHQVRRALRRDPQASVTEVALRFGFGNLGRFAAEYRQLFGERPSRTRADRSR